ncbi:MAG: hypothetical protein K2K13_03955, partial [Clostridiales bacterium]|nr:hypothetical protein [Clostridiales bacterium]
MSDENSLKTTGHANKTISARDNKRFTEYFVNMVTKLSSSDNNYDFISSDDDYYVSVPTNIDIDIVVKNKEITEIYETQNGLYCKDNKIEKYRKTRFLDKFNEIINDNTETKLLFKPLWRDGRKIRFKTLSVIDAVCANQFCIAEGAPGSGKSTMIRHITSSLVQQYRKKECLLSNDTLSSLFKDNAFLPMYLPINNICDLDGDNINLNNVLEKTYGLKEAELQAGELKDFIINENIIYLIDCADEV